MSKFSENILKAQKELKKIYEREIERIGGISIWEKISGDGKMDESSEKSK